MTSIHLKIRFLNEAAKLGILTRIKAILFSFSGSYK